MKNEIRKTAKGFEAISAGYGYIGTFQNESEARIALATCDRNAP